MVFRLVAVLVELSVVGMALKSAVSKVGQTVALKDDKKVVMLVVMSAV